MLKQYLQKIGLEENKNNDGLNEIVEDSFAKSTSEFDIEKLYIYDVPKMGPNGACSITHEKEDKPYNIAETFGFKDEELNNHPFTLTMWRLNQVIQELYKIVPADWLGIYKRIKKTLTPTLSLEGEGVGKDGQDVLLKLAYRGVFSRAEFPLTEEFAKGSNNSTVGLSGKAIIVQDVSSYAGPYYECDNKVMSEFCIPILDEKSNVIGIIDAESFQKNFFTKERLLQIAKICYDLGHTKDFIDISV